MRRLKFTLILLTLLFIGVYNNAKADTIITKTDTIWLSSKATSEQYNSEIIRLLSVDNKIKDETIKSLQSQIKEQNSSYNFYKWFFYIVLVLLFLLLFAVINFLSGIKFR